MADRVEMVNRMNEVPEDFNRLSDTFAAGSRSHEAQQQADGVCGVLVQKLRDDITEEELVELLNATSPAVLSCQLTLPNIHHMTRCAYVTFSTPEAARHAVATWNGSFPDLNNENRIYLTAVANDSYFYQV